MGIEDGIGKINTRPSKLEMRLEAHKNRETGHIVLGPGDAKNILFYALLSAHRANVSRPNSTVEVLAQIAEKDESKLFDFTEALLKFENEQAEKERNAREKEETLGMLLRSTPRVPPVPEI